MWFSKKTPPPAPPAPPPPADPHAECRTKRRVIVVYKKKKNGSVWSAFVLEEFEDYTLICNEYNPHHQWVATSQIGELVPLKSDQDCAELERLYKL